MVSRFTCTPSIVENCDTNHMTNFVCSAHLEGFLESPETPAGSGANMFNPAPDGVTTLVTSTSCRSGANPAAFFADQAPEACAVVLVASYAQQRYGPSLW